MMRDPDDQLEPPQIHNEPVYTTSGHVQHIIWLVSQSENDLQREIDVLRYLVDNNLNIKRSV